VLKGFRQGISEPSDTQNGFYAVGAVHPNLHSLFMSGYTGDLIALRGGLVPEAAFLEKPFTRSSLLKKVRSALQSEPTKRQAS
jgi:hypothetical protein